MREIVEFRVVEEFAPKRIPKSKEISRTIAGEFVISGRVKELFARHLITGAKLNPVRYSQNSSAESSDWFQLILTNTDAEIVSPTRVGIDPFDEDEKGETRIFDLSLFSVSC